LEMTDENPNESEDISTFLIGLSENKSK